MKTALAICALLAASLFQAEAEAQVSVRSSAAAFVEVATTACLSVANGSTNFANSTPEQDEASIGSFGLEYGIDGEILDRFGTVGSGILNRAIMGNIPVQGDAVVLAIGGAMPGCKVILLSTTAESPQDAVASLLAAAQPSWRELPFNRSRAGTAVTMRRFIYRDLSGRPFLLNLIIAPVPDSQIKLVATVNAIPDNVAIPEGF